MKTYRIITTLLSAAVFVSCNYLDFDETNGLNTHDNIYKYFDNTKQMLTNVYSYIPQDFGAVEEAMRDCASDDAEFGNTGGGVQDFNNGNWSALRTHDTAWSLYNGIRAANEFIASIADVDFSRFEYGPSYPNWERQLRYFPYEARMLRAFYFFELARRYGDIAMPTRVLTIEEANTIGKMSFDEVIGFIVAECDACAADGNLPNTYVGEPGNETGRITRGFALALKSKALLYAASELHNPSMDVERWKRSAKAALDLIETGLYSLDPADKSNNITSPEVVLLRMNSDDNTFELRNFPIRFTEGRRTTAATGTFPTQELVDAYRKLDGSVADDTDYEKRDKRFEATIAFNGCTVDIPDAKGLGLIGSEGKGKGSYTCYTRAEDEKKQNDNERFDSYNGTQDRTATGYYTLKNYNADMVDSKGNTYKSLMEIRYADVLLMYAESMNEQSKMTSDIWDKTIKPLRERAGFDAAYCSYPGSSDLRQIIRDERRVELALEGRRAFDLRRWALLDNPSLKSTGATYLTTRATGAPFLDDGSNIQCQNAYGMKYWFPIPQKERDINANLPQNPGW